MFHNLCWTFAHIRYRAMLPQHLLSKWSKPLSYKVESPVARHTLTITVLYCTKKHRDGHRPSSTCSTAHSSRIKNFCFLNFTPNSVWLQNQESQVMVSWDALAGRQPWGTVAEVEGTDRNTFSSDLEEQGLETQPPVTRNDMAPVVTAEPEPSGQVAGWSLVSETASFCTLCEEDWLWTLTSSCKDYSISITSSLLCDSLLLDRIWKCLGGQIAWVPGLLPPLHCRTPCSVCHPHFRSKHLGDIACLDKLHKLKCCSRLQTTNSFPQADDS